mgnify:CR=1 FL=1
MSIYRYVDCIMEKQKTDTGTRQIYASIREDLYLAAKNRATELRIPLREFVELAIALTLKKDSTTSVDSSGSSIWDDEYLNIQSQQPLGSPVELTREEAEKVVRDSFKREDTKPNFAESNTIDKQDLDITGTGL